MSDPVDQLFSDFGSATAAPTATEQPQRKRLRTAASSDHVETVNGKQDKVRERFSTVQKNSNEDDAPEEVVIETYEGDYNCLHECIRPRSTGTDAQPVDSFAGPYPKTPARKFPYKLDPFQATAIRCLEIGESVLVSAHTSAGKTTVAEYAVAMGLRDKQRVIYTSPIKALSNQKYRDLSNIYGDEVGLLTGDVSLNPSASVIIMTTEILRSMLYRGSEMVREMKWVIFDEIHYMRDRDRGVVWEETIILLPDTVRLVFLSATIPNAREFAEWICRIKHQPCHVIYTDYRPVPLQHYLFPAGGDSVHMVMDEKKVFMDANFHKAVAELNKTLDGQQTDIKTKAAKKNARSDIEKIVMMCHERNYTPVIIFGFSKREIEANALSMKKVKLSSLEEEELIEKIFNNAMETLGEDSSIPQVAHMLPLLKQGIGLHHGGLLPIIKEIVEILFQESLVKVLFSTETFSMGVNMPAKTVVFTKLKKFDGTSFRLVSAGEYIQMSGRAGRRGLDERGLTIIMFDEKMEPEVAKELFLGEPLRIESQFHLGYNMLLNLMRVEGADPSYMIKRSFYQFQQDKATMQLEDRKNVVEKALEELSDISSSALDRKAALPEGVDANKAIAEYYSAKHQSEKLVVRDTSGSDWGYGVVLETAQRQKPPPKRGVTDVGVFAGSRYLWRFPANRTSKPYNAAKAVEGEEGGVWDVVSCTLPMLRELTQVVVTMPQHLGNSVESWQAIGGIMTEITSQLNGSFPTIDPITNMKIVDPRLEQILKDLGRLEKSILNNPLHGHADLAPVYAKFHERVQLNTEKQDLERKLDAQKNLVMRDDLRAMRRVLRKLQYVDENNVVTVKGRAACEISSVDELVVCELLFLNTFDQMPTEYLVAMLSCLVFDEKADDFPPSDPKLLQAFELVKTSARNVAQVSAEAKLPININDYVDKFKSVLMEVALKWFHGAKFSDLGFSDDLFEGSVVRALRRLEELLRQLAGAGKTIGHETLEARFSEAIARMRRGIVFSASLYL